jgi:hypothetical protein
MSSFLKYRHSVLRAIGLPVSLFVGSPLPASRTRQFLACHFQSSHNPNKFKLEAILEAQR